MGPQISKKRAKREKVFRGYCSTYFCINYNYNCGTPQLTAAESQPSSVQLTGEGALEAGRSMLANRKPVSFWTQNGIPIWGMISSKTLTSGLQTFDLQTSPKRRASNYILCKDWWSRSKPKIGNITKLFFRNSMAVSAFTAYASGCLNQLKFIKIRLGYFCVNCINLRILKSTKKILYY